MNWAMQKDPDWGMHLVLWKEYERENRLEHPLDPGKAMNSVIQKDHYWEVSWETCLDRNSL